MGLMQNFNSNLTVLVFPPGLLNQNFWRRKSAPTRTSARARRKIYDSIDSWHSSERLTRPLMTELPRLWARRSTPPAKTFHDTGQPTIVYEVIAKRIIDAAKNGERDPVRLRNAGLTALGFDDDDKDKEAS
jgi:hypothetical protein